jgi:hypothetical protein
MFTLNQQISWNDKIQFSYTKRHNTLLTYVFWVVYHTSIPIYIKVALVCDHHLFVFKKAIYNI